VQIVTDANPIISIIIKPNRLTVELLFLEELEIFAPKLLFDEIEQNKDIIIKKSGLTGGEFDKFLAILKKRIRVVPEEEFLKFRSKAEEICPDEKDVAYFALALDLKCPVWSNEKNLKEQSHVNVYATHELIEMFRIK
jgi:predicted nucleic acid-binding protein